MINKNIFTRDLRTRVDDSDKFFFFTLRQTSLYYDSRLQIFLKIQIYNQKQLGKTQNPADIKTIPKAAFFMEILI